MCRLFPLAESFALVGILFPGFFSDLPFPPFMSSRLLNAFILAFCNFVIILVLLSDGISLFSIQRDF